MRSIILIIATIVLIANAMKQPKETPLWKADSEISKEFEIAQAKYLKDRAAGKAKSQNVAKDQSLQLEARSLAYSRTKPGTLSFFEPTIPFVSKKVDAGASIKRGEMATYHPVVLDFMQQNGNSFGLRDVSNEIVFKQTRPVDENATNVVYKQQHNGFPVYGGEILFQFNDQHLSIGMVVNTMVNTDSALDTVAKISKERAEEIAFTASGNPQNVVVTQSSLQFYNKDHYFEREGPTKLCWVIVLKTTQQFVNFRHRLFINAITGEVEQDVDLSEGALNRRFYKGTISTTTYQEGQTVGSDTVLQTMVRGAADVYYAMKNLTNFDSFDNAGGQMKGLYDAALKDSSGNSACPNAYWDSVQTNYCPNLGTYDVIVHEWGHAFTEYYSNLEYQGMSGALNEGYSDIYAETLQLLNNIPSTYTVRTSYACLTNIATRTGGARWIIGDQITGVSAFTDGLRDMWAPNCKSQPEDTSDTDYAVCNTASGADNGGVHTNSGIPNKAYASFVDGIIGNPSVPGVGLVKAINVYARAALAHTESSTFANHYSLLNTACTQLVGQTIKNPATGATSTSITSGDCTQLTAALNLVGMNAGLCGGNSNSGSTKPTLTSYYPPYQSRSASTSVVAFVGQGFKSTAGCVFTSGTYIGFTNGDAYDSTNGQFQFFFCDFDGTDWASFTNVNGTVANDISARISGDRTSVANQYGPLIMYTNPYVSSWTTDGATVTFYRGALGGFFQQYSGCNPGSIDANGDSYDCLSCWWTSDFTTSHQYAATFIDSGSISCKIPTGYSPFQTSMYFSLNGWVFTSVDRSLYVDSASSIFVSMFVLIGSLFVALLF